MRTLCLASALPLVVAAVAVLAPLRARCAALRAEVVAMKPLPPPAGAPDLAAWRALRAEYEDDLRTLARHHAERDADLERSWVPDHALHDALRDAAAALGLPWQEPGGLPASDRRKRLDILRQLAALPGRVREVSFEGRAVELHGELGTAFPFALDVELAFEEVPRLVRALLAGPLPIDVVAADVLISRQNPHEAGDLAVVPVPARARLSCRVVDFETSALSLCTAPR